MDSSAGMSKQPCQLTWLWHKGDAAAGPAPQHHSEMPAMAHSPAWEPHKVRIAQYGLPTHLKLIRLVGSLPRKEQISALSVAPTHTRVWGVNLRLVLSDTSYRAVSCSCCCQG